MAMEATRTSRRRRRARRAWPRTLALLLLAIVLAPVVLIVLFRFVNPPITAVMLAERLRGTPLEHQWVPISEMSANLPVAAIAAEDGQFCRHWGVDWSAVREVIRSGGDLSEMRGASTIPMQTAKNLFLWRGRSYVAKALEVPLAYLLSVLWPKQRVMEVYLNVVQLGPHIFGAEAASRHYFQKSAAELSQSEAVLLAATLPSPRLRNPAKPSGRMRAVAHAINSRFAIMQGRSACVLGARAGLLP